MGRIDRRVGCNWVMGFASRHSENKGRPVREPIPAGFRPNPRNGRAPPLVAIGRHFPAFFFLPFGLFRRRRLFFILDLLLFLSVGRYFFFFMETTLYRTRQGGPSQPAALVVVVVVVVVVDDAAQCADLTCRPSDE